MTSLPADPAGSHPTQGAGARGARAERATPDAVCPLLRSADGAWTSVHPSRDLRCWAAQPPIAPAVAKQRSLCVTQRHVACATYEAAVGAEGSGVATREGSLLWPTVSTVPVALEPPMGRRLGIGVGRSTSQFVLVALMVVAFAVLLISRTPLAGGPTAASMLPVASATTAASAAAGASASAAPASSPAATPSTAASATPSRPAVSASPSASPLSSPRTYTVRAGDTLAMIAGKYHTTVKAIVTANSITDPRTIHPGQVLIIP